MNAGRHATAIVLLAGVAALHPHAQAPAPRDARPVRTGTAVLWGTVVSDDTEARPVRHARVTCAAPELTEGLTAVTDDLGRFRCARLPPGRYSVSVTRDAWVPTAYGATRPLRAGTPIPLVEGQHGDIVIRMMRGAVITGTLLDESGRPAVNMVVAALRKTVEDGEPRLVAAGVPGVTDERGVYRIYGLAPGDYVVGTAGGVPAGGPPELRETTNLDLHHARTASPAAPAPPQRGIAYAATYFPGTPLPAQAGFISLRPGEERPGVDFAVQLVATARVEGSVSLPDGGPLPSNAQLTLLASRDTAFPGVAFDGLRSTRLASDGAFSFAAVSPGLYTLIARASSPQRAASDAGAGDRFPQVLWATTEIAVDGERVSGLRLTLQPALTVSGRLRFDGGSRSRPPADLKGVKVSLEPVQRVGDVSLSPGTGTVESDGRFLVTGVVPGWYRLSASLPAGGSQRAWALRSALVNGADTLDVPLHVEPNQHVTDAVITFTDHPARLAGTVENAGGAGTAATVVVFATNQALWMPRSRRIQAVRASIEGGYLFDNIPPGEYFLAAVADADPGEWFDAAFLQRVAPAAIRVIVGESDQRVRRLRLGG